MRAATFVAWLIVHSLFTGAGVIALLAFVTDSGQQSPGILIYSLFAIVLGLPWSLLLWPLAGTIGLAPLWVAVVANYTILWRRTLISRGWTVGDTETGDLAQRSSISFRQKVRFGILVPVAAFIAVQLAVISLLPSSEWQREGILLASCAVGPGLSIANWWLLPIPFRARRGALLAGMALPTTLLILERFWLGGPLQTIDPLWGWIVAALFLVPLLFSVVHVIVGRASSPRKAPHVRTA